MMWSFSRRRWPGLFATVIAVLMLLSPASALAGLPGSFNFDPGSADVTVGGAPAHGLLSEKVEASLLDGLLAGETADFWIIIDESPDLSLTAEMSWEERGQYVYEQLTKTAAASQARITAHLDRSAAAYEQFWITNAIRVDGGDLNLLSSLVSFPEVTEVLADAVHPLVEPEPGIAEETINNVEWGVADIRADRVWDDYDLDGSGIVIGSIDTGVLYSHPALVRQYRGRNDDGSFDHNYNWFDPSNVCGDPASGPCDGNGHGTHTVGTMVGDDGGSNKVGVAPGAKWMAARGCESGGCSTAALARSMEFMLAPTDLNGNNPDPSMRPHIVNNSWGGPNPNPIFHSAVQHWVAAGMFPVFAAGNSGPACGTVGSPGLFPESYAVGNYTIDHQISPTSSRGPAPSPYAGTKPNVSAPGTNIRSTWTNGGYAAISGTSMAAPHVAGAIALVWSMGDLIGEVEVTRQLFDETAIPVKDLSCGGEPEFNNVWGRGRIDVYAVVEEVYEGERAFLTGTVIDKNDELPVAGAEISVYDEDDNLERVVRTDINGKYRTSLPLGKYGVEAQAANYVSEKGDAALEIEGAEEKLDFVLSTGALVVDPDSFSFTMNEGEGTEATITLTNEGSAPVKWKGMAYGRKFPVEVYSSPDDAGHPDNFTGVSSAVHTAGQSIPAAVTSADSRYYGASGQAFDGPLADVIWGAGDVIKSFEAKMTVNAYGIGYDGEDVWVSSTRTHKATQFSTDGERGQTVDLSGIPGAWPGDMTYHSEKGLFCQMFPGDNTAYCWDRAGKPVDGIRVSVANALRAVAYREDDGTFYVGGDWQTGNIYHVKGFDDDNPGEIISQCSVPTILVSGLAYNSEAGVLWAATNGQGDPILQLDPDTCQVLGAIPHPAPAGPAGHGGGISLNEDGDLWIVSQTLRMAYLVDSSLPTDIESSWLKFDTQERILNPGESAEIPFGVDGSVVPAGRYTGFIRIESDSGREPVVTVPVDLNLELAEKGIIKGTIFDAEDDHPVAGARVEIHNDQGHVTKLVTGEDGRYEYAGRPGEYMVAAMARHYREEKRPAVIEGDGSVYEADLSLATAKVEVEEVIELSLPVGEEGYEALFIHNRGSMDTEWWARIRNYDESAAGIGAASGPTRLINSWPAVDIEVPFGIAYAKGRLWVSDVEGSQNVEYEEDGHSTGRVWETYWAKPFFLEGFAAGMTYVPEYDLMCQLKVLPAQYPPGIYCWDMDTGEVMETITEGYLWNRMPQHGIAYRADGDLFYVGGFGAGEIFTIKGLGHDTPGEIVDQCTPPREARSISGLAWNPDAGVLWAATNSAEDTIYKLDPDTCGILGSVAHPEGGRFNGGGIDIDDQGNLWVVSQSGQNVYSIETDEPYSPVSWLTLEVDHGRIPPNGEDKTVAYVNTWDLEPGIHEGWIEIKSQSGRRPSVFVQVKLEVQETPMATVYGAVTDANDGGPLSGAQLTFYRDGHIVKELESGEDGSYTLDLPVARYELEVSKEHYRTEKVELDYTEDGQTDERNFAMATGALKVGPESFDVVLPRGTVETYDFAMGNAGGIEAEFAISKRSSLPDPEAKQYEPGEVITQWLPTGLGDTAYHMHHHDGKLWLSTSIRNTTPRIAEYYPDGTPTGRVHNFSGRTAGLTYNDAEDLLCHIVRQSVRGIECWDMETGEIVKSITGSWATIDQRDLAYREDNDTFYLGAAGGTLRVIAGFSHDEPGAVISQCALEDQYVMGIVYNAAAGVIWQSTQWGSDPVHMVDVETCKTLWSFNHPDPGYNGVGVAMNEDGDLWFGGLQRPRIYLVHTGVPADNIDWVEAEPSRGTVGAGRELAATVTFDAQNAAPGQHTAYLMVDSNSGREPTIAVPVSMQVLAAETALVHGIIEDVNDGGPVAGASVTAKQDGEVIRRGITDEDGYYALHLPLGSYTLEFTAENYTMTAKDVEVQEEYGSVTADAALETARGKLSPDSLEFTINPGGFDEGVITIENTGTATMTWELETARPLSAKSTAGTAVMEEGYDPDSRTSEGIDWTGEAAPLAPGRVIKQWHTGLELPYGVGFYGDLVIGNATGGDGRGGDDYNYIFTTDGELLKRWDTSYWADSWGADITYDANNDLLWQVNVGGDNCLYGLDPYDGAVKETICGAPWDHISQRGVAYRASDDTFFIGGWNDGIIYHIEGLSSDVPGTVIEEIHPTRPAISGLAWNETEKVLWVVTNEAQSAVYALSEHQGWEEIAAFRHPDDSGFSTGAGISIDLDGNLWVAGQKDRTAYLVESDIPDEGEPRNPAPWLKIGATEGTVEAGGSTDITVIANDPDMEPGTYEASLRIKTNSGREPRVLVVRVTLHVSGEGDLMLTVTDPEHETHTNADFITVAGTAADPAGGAVTVTVNGEEVPVDDDGSFTFVELLPEDDGAYDIVVTAVGENGAEATETRTVYVDRTDPVIDEDSIEPAEDVELAPGESVTIGYTGEPGLTAGYTVLAAGAGGSGFTSSVPGTPVEEVGEGVYEAVYTAPDDAEFENATIEFHIADAAGNTITVQAPGRITVRPSYTAPDIEITEPEEGYLTNSQAVRISGVATDEQGIETLTIDGREVSVDDDGSFTGRALLDEGTNVIEVTATNMMGLETTATVTVIADWTAPELNNIVPAEDVMLEWGESLEISFTGESGLTAAYQLIVNGVTATDGVASPGESILVRGVPFEEVEEGVYRAVYTAPQASFENAEIQINAMDPAGNKTHVVAPGRVTVVPAAEPVGPPELIITEPEDGLLTNRGAVRVSGVATDDHPGQSVEEVTVNGRRVAVEDDGSFTTRIALVEGANLITVTAANTAGETATETVTITADWTPPELTGMEPAEDVTLVGGQSYTVRFTGEPGLTAAFQVIIGGQRGKWHGQDIPVRGVAMVEVESGVYEGVYTAPAGTAFTQAIVQFNAADAAGNVTMVTAPGSITVVRQ